MGADVSVSRALPILALALILLFPGAAVAAVGAPPQPRRVSVPATHVRPSAAKLGTVTAIVDNTVPKRDTSGARIDAHEGTIVYDSGTYWMIGNTYSCAGGYQWIHAASTWCGFRTYSSPDLVAWTNRGSTFDPTPAYWQTLCSGMGCFDARLIHDATASPPQWRLWLNAYNSRSGYEVLSAPAITGPWRLMPTPNLALNNNDATGRGNGAGGLYTAGDGTGYLIYTDWPDGGLDIVEKLDPHYVTGTGVHVHIPNLSAEAPSLFNGPGGEVVVTYDDPGCAWCAGVPTAYATSSGPLGLWAVGGQISTTSCAGQAASQVATLHSGQLLWIADQWTNAAPAPRGPGVPGWTGMTDINYDQDWNQTNATQSWEPLRFTADGGVAPVTCPDDATLVP